MTFRYYSAIIAPICLLILLACGADVSSPTPPPPPPPPVVPPSPIPVPLALAINPPSRRATSQPGAVAPADNAAITLSGDNASAAQWTASKRQPWTTITAPAGTGSGSVAWTRSNTGLSVGIYVDTITITAPGAAGSPAFIMDTLQVTAAPIPLSLVVTPRFRVSTAIQGATVSDDNVAITLSGDGASAAAWSATSSSAWATIIAGGRTGSGSLAWHRNTAGLNVGVYVDTITVAATGAIGSPITVVDTLRITPVPVPLVLAVSPSSRNVSIVQGTTAPSATATVTLTGDNAGTTPWTSTNKKSWTTLTTASGAGNGSLTWSRNVAALGVGTYVDTISITAAGATGSPATVLDTIQVTPVISGITPDLGLLADLHGKQFFPASDPWNQSVDTAPVDANSAAILALIGVGKSLHPDFGPTWGIPYIVVPDALVRSPVIFDYDDQSDHAPYPIPANPPIEDGSDAHLLVITQHEWKLFELFALRQEGGQWAAGSGAIFDLTNGTTRPAGWTSADAAGLPILPGLVRYDEVYGRGEITHAIRFTVQHSQMAYVAPARHWASSSTNPLFAPMGMRVRLRANFDISGYPAPAQVILRALKKYGMIMADNGSDFFMSGTADPRWDDDIDNLLKQVKVGDFEVIRMDGVVRGF